MKMPIGFDEFEDYSLQARPVRVRPKRLRDSGDREPSKELLWSARGSADFGHRQRPRTPDEIEFGDVLTAPNEFLHIANARTKDHPCACLCEWGEQSIALLKGTDAVTLNPRYRSEYVCVDATQANGLKKQTAFRRQPLKLPFRRVALLYPERHLGRLDVVQQELVFKAVKIPPPADGEQRS